MSVTSNTSMLSPGEIGPSAAARMIGAGACGPGRLALAGGRSSASVDGRR
jgi:hypothetical protein